MSKIPGVAERLESQSLTCADMGSSLYGQMLAMAACDYRSGREVARFFTRRPERAQRSGSGVRLMGALHFLALSGEAPELAAHLPSCGGDGDAAAAWEGARTALSTHEDAVAELYEETPQTNEVARSTVLLGGALSISARVGMPMRIFDVGASAGLNTRFDQYRYETDEWSWGDPQSALVLRNRERSGRPRALDADLEIVERAACDVNPLDIDCDRDRMRLLSFVWADQVDRVERLRSAIAAARATPLCPLRADLFRWIGQSVEPLDDTVTVIMHSVMAEHLDFDDRLRLEATIAGVGASARRNAPVAWLRMEFDAQTRAYETRVTLWPLGEEVLVARSDGHAQNISWMG